MASLWTARITLAGVIMLAACDNRGASVPGEESSPADRPGAGIDSATLEADSATLRDSNQIEIEIPNIVHRYPTPELCEGMACGCGYGSWTVLDTLTVYETEADTSSRIATLVPGDSIVAEAGYDHVVRPGVTVLDDTLRLGSLYEFLPGDTVYTLQHLGEGTYKVWFKGQVIDWVEAYWSGDPNIRVPDPDGRMIALPVIQWWVQITFGGREGWIHPTHRSQLQGANFWCIRQ